MRKLSSVLISGYDPNIRIVLRMSLSGIVRRRMHYCGVFRFLSIVPRFLFRWKTSVVSHTCLFSSFDRLWDEGFSSGVVVPLGMISGDVVETRVSVWWRSQRPVVICFPVLFGFASSTNVPGI